MKTAEEILNEKRTLIHYPTKELIIEAMEKYADQFRQDNVSGSVCDHKEKRRIFENCECVKCGALFIE